MLAAVLVYTKLSLSGQRATNELRIFGDDPRVRLGWLPVDPSDWESKNPLDGPRVVWGPIPREWWLPIFFLLSLFLYTWKIRYLGILVVLPSGEFCELWGFFLLPNRFDFWWNGLASTLQSHFAYLTRFFARVLLSFAIIKFQIILSRGTRQMLSLSMVTLFNRLIFMQTSFCSQLSCSCTPWTAMKTTRGRIRRVIIIQSVHKRVYNSLTWKSPRFWLRWASKFPRKDWFGSTATCELRERSATFAATSPPQASTRTSKAASPCVAAKKKKRDNERMCKGKWQCWNVNEQENQILIPIFIVKITPKQIPNAQTC